MHTIMLQCDRTQSLSEFFKRVQEWELDYGSGSGASVTSGNSSNTRAHVALLGCGCSGASEPVAEIIHHWNIPQVRKGGEGRIG